MQLVLWIYPKRFGCLDKSEILLEIFTRVRCDDSSSDSNGAIWSSLRSE